MATAPTAILLLLLLFPAQGPARLPQDPAALTFDVSPDHAVVDANGPRVLKYLIDFSPVDGLGTARTVDIGKPAAPDGVITVPLAPLKLAPGRYLASVRVQGPTTSAVSGTVGPFQLGKVKAKEPEVAPPAPSPGHDQGHEAPPPADNGSPRGRKGGFWRRLYGLIVG